MVRATPSRRPPQSGAEVAGEADGPPSAGPRAGAADAEAVQPTPRWILAAGALAVLAAAAGAFLWVAPDSGGPAPLLLVSPRDGDTLAAPLTLTFETTAPLGLGPRGWTAGDHHLHASVGAVEWMPGAAEVRPLPSDGVRSFRWVLAGVPPGTHLVRLYWSDLRHSPLPAGGSAPVRVTVVDSSGAGGPADTVPLDHGLHPQ